MWQSTSVMEKKINDETHKIVTKIQIQKYCNFLDQLNRDTINYQEKLSNFNQVLIKPIALKTTNTNDREPVYLFSNPNNEELSRILYSFNLNCDEITLLVAEADEHYKELIFYNEDAIKKGTVQSISDLLDRLQRIYLYILRCKTVIELLIKNLVATLSTGNYSSGGMCNFPEVLNSLSELLVCTLTINTLLENDTLKENWVIYRRSIRNALHNNSKFDFNIEQIANLDSCLNILENELLNKDILQFILDSIFTPQMRADCKKCNLTVDFSLYLSTLIQELEKHDDNIMFSNILLQLNLLMICTFAMSEREDKKLFKKVMDLNKKVSTCFLIGNILWYPEKFLLKYIKAPDIRKLIDEKAMESNRLLLINTRSQNLPKETFAICSQACFWMLELENLIKKDSRQFTAKDLQEITDFLLDGLRFVKKISGLIKWIINLHSDKGLPITKSIILTLCKLLEVVKSIYNLFKKHSMVLIYITLLISQHMNHKALSLLEKLKEQFSKEKSQKKHKIDVPSALYLCEQALKGADGNNRVLVINLALSVGGLLMETIEIRNIMSRFHLITNFEDILKRCSDCSFLYWHEMYILPIYFSKLINSKADLSRYHLLLNAVSDCTSLGNDKMQEITDGIMKQNLLAPLNQIVDINLRYQTHLHLELPATDSLSSYFPLNFQKFTPALLKDEYKCIKNETEHYLSTMFYNLTTVVLHDWKTYGEMRRLAALQYGLETVDDKLPIQTLEQGLDVLEILRNINVFVSKYLYNLNSQIFIQESSNNKHLNSINISHVANSIRTHGIGIMNSTVNYTYQFLRKQFYIFSQFMFDEHIKSRLLKDLRFFSEHKQELNQMYPYERAEKFNTGIRKLGLNNNGQSYLDLFRKMITSLGNAMGFIRLIRSGGKRCLADGTSFIPDLMDIENLRQLLQEEENMSELTKKAAEGLLDDLQNFAENFEEATEYFKLLVNVFVPVFRNKNNVHLTFFFIIVPPLTINFVEHSITCKEMLNKKNKNDSSFTDDGFALGLAYIIELLNQESQLNSLHWFHSVQKKIKTERDKIREQESQVSSVDAEKIQQMLALTKKRISKLEREFQLFYYSFTSARLFFHS